MRQKRAETALSVLEIRNGLIYEFLTIFCRGCLSWILDNFDPSRRVLRKLFFKFLVQEFGPVETNFDVQCVFDCKSIGHSTNLVLLCLVSF